MMMRRHCPLLVTAISVLLLNGGFLHRDPRAQARGQNSISFDGAPLHEFIWTMMQRLDIAVVLVDGVKLQGSVTLHKEAPVSKQDLLDLFIEGLRANGATLVNSGAVTQIIPKSRDLGEGFEAIGSAAALVPRRGSGVQMSYDNVPLSVFCGQVADLLNIVPIVISPAIRGSVTIISAGATSAEQVYLTLMAALKNNNALLIESGGKYQVIPASADIPQGWSTLRRLPAPYDPRVRRQRRLVKEEELEAHIASRVEHTPVLIGGKKLTGRVLVQISLNERGELDVVQVVQPSSLPLCEAAIEIVKQWRFTPFFGANGQPERVYFLITIAFDAPN